MSKKKQAKANKKVRKQKATQESFFSKYGLLAFVLLFTFICFSGTFNNDFVNWDDDVNILKNTNLTEFSAENIGRIFHPVHGRVIGNYNPLPIFTFAVEKALFGLNPQVFHFNNLLLHLLCVFFVFLLGKRMGLSPLASGLLALLFGIHPMRVESVAWATERKDVLFGAFYLGAMLTWLKYLGGQGKKWFWYTFLLFIFSLFSKIQAVSLPLTLLALDYWEKRQLNLKLIIEKTPFWVFSLLFGIAGIIFLGEDGSLKDQTQYSIFERLLVGAYSYVVYLFKWIFPYEMSPMYPYPSSLNSLFYAAPLGVVSVAGLFWFAFKQELRAVAFGIAFFTFNIMFLLQILGAGQGFTADRFTYIAYFGLFFMTCYAVDYILKQKPNLKSIALGGAVVFLGLYSFLTFKQIKIWENGLTLWTHVNKYYDNVTTPWVNLGHFYRDAGQRDKAIEFYSKAIEIDGNDGKIYNSRGKMLLEKGEAQAALNDFTKGTQFSPSIGEIHVNQAAAYGTLGNYQAALTSVNKGLALDSDNKNGYSNRSMIYFLTKDYEKALADHDNYLRLDRNNAAIWYERGQVSNLLGQYNKALESLNQALRLRPGEKLYHRERAKTHQALGNTAAAQADAAKGS